MKHVREDQIVVLSTHIVQDIENLLTDVIVLRKDAPVYAASLEEIASRYSFGIQSNEEGVLYAEVYRVPCNHYISRKTWIRKYLWNCCLMH